MKRDTEGFKGASERPSPAEPSDMISETDSMRIGCGK
jgi:hypothetical protein